MPRASFSQMRCAPAELFSAAKWTCPWDCHGLARQKAGLGNPLESDVAGRSPWKVDSARCHNGTDSLNSVNPRLTCGFSRYRRSGAYGAPVAFRTMTAGSRL